ncbi:Ankyrin-repeat protein [Orpheovirus IHUMI-LCC2]|uniref:Ankyrin-repeat protein n=1 Tax=Orpheovirus IHUMI-LCC2 TaxID=2023057 RepID=A0A2I2L5X6_9VIRU|nr:Ankyrin-repeat protein [Orpheovirus IHUMI-LCC2]SNW62958.1 Ankyrin-repeat protein [Orpheovirus IHUMI-LCC2]
MEQLYVDHPKYSYLWKKLEFDDIICINSFNKENNSSYNDWNNLINYIDNLDYQNMEIFIELSKRGELYVLDYLLEISQLKNKFINIYDIYNKDVLKYLNILAKEIQINAVQAGHLKLLKYIKNICGELHIGTLEYACKCGSLQMVQFISEYFNYQGRINEINIVSCIFISVIQKNLDITKYLYSKIQISQEDINLLLCRSVECQDVASIKFFIENGADIRYNYGYLLWTSFKVKDREIKKILRCKRVNRWVNKGIKEKYIVEGKIGNRKNRKIKDDEEENLFSLQFKGLNYNILHGIILWGTKHNYLYIVMEATHRLLHKIYIQEPYELRDNKKNNIITHAIKVSHKYNRVDIIPFLSTVLQYNIFDYINS